MSTSLTKPLWSLPSKERPPHGSLLSGLLWAVLFNLGIILTHSLQLLLLPFYLIPSTRSKFHRWTKAPFGMLCVAISQWFAPTKFVISNDGGNVQEWVERDQNGRVKGLRLPKRAVWMSNHQTLCDWIYIWTFAYLSSHSNSIVITLKASLRAIPIIGWACHFYSFIFLQRKWLTDQDPFKAQLVQTAKDLKLGAGAGGLGQGRAEEEKLALLIFPEGTLVTGNTRPISLKYAEKIGVPDFSHVLLPRSTGLLFSLRVLAREVPGLHLVDLTLAYPGTHLPQPEGSKPTWPEDYYSLGIWWKGVAPPAIHVHVRTFKASDIPLGNLESEKGEDETRKEFDEWLRARWGEKDDLMKTFVETGSFVKDGEKVEWPVELRHWWEGLGAFSFGVPVIVLLVFWGWWSGWFKGTDRGGAMMEKVLKPCCAKAAQKAMEAKKVLGEL